MEITRSGRLIDLSTFLSRYPPDSDTLRAIEAFRAEIEVEVHQTAQGVQKRKEHPHTGTDMGVRFSREAVREIEDSVVAYCSRLYAFAGKAYAARPPLGAELTSLFEELAGATVLEALRFFRNATAGAWFERTPSMEGVRLREELGNQAPETAYYVDPAPTSFRVQNLLCERIERLRDDLTVAALRRRADRLRESASAQSDLQQGPVPAATLSGAAEHDPFATQESRQAAVDKAAAQHGTVKAVAGWILVDYRDLRKWVRDRGQTLAKTRSSKVDRIEEALNSLL